jgi:cellulose 1,4-beta-cellobiosidase
MNKIIPVLLIIIMVAALSGCVSTPNSPTRVTATATSSSTITINWQPSPGATHYTIYRGTGYFTLANSADLGTVTVPSFTDTGLSAGTTYFYEIIASNGAGRSAPSSPAAYATTASAAPTTPSTPTGVGIRGIVATTNSIQISWDQSPDATSYIVYRSTSSSGPFTAVNTVTVPSFTDTGLSAGTTYYYEITASNSAGLFSEPSYPPEPATTAPTAPTNVRAQARTYNLIDLSWTPSTGATIYTIYRSTSSSGPYYKDSGDLVGGTISSFADTALSASTTYYYEITASNVGGESARSSPPADATTYSIHDCQVNPQRC